MQLLDILNHKKIILASRSPRRHYLLNELGLNFEIKFSRETNEEYPDNLANKEIPVYLAEKKANSLKKELNNSDIIIAADTIVWCDNKVINKPTDISDAINILKTLSGKKHQVITGVCLLSKTNSNSFFSITDVFFKELSLEEINYYIENYKPLDKAGAYGIQEWIGYIGIEKIEGSYFNVMGLPIQKLYIELQKFINQ